MALKLSLSGKSNFVSRFQRNVFVLETNFTHSYSCKFKYQMTMFSIFFFLAYRFLSLFWWGNTYLGTTCLRRLAVNLLLLNTFAAFKEIIQGYMDQNLKELIKNPKRKNLLLQQQWNSFENCSQLMRMRPDTQQGKKSRWTCYKSWQ